MEESHTQKWLIVKPEALLWALEEVEEGRPATDVLLEVLDIANDLPEDQSDL